MADLDGSDASPPGSQASYSQYKSEDGRESWATRPSSAGSTQIYTPSILNRTTASTSPSPSNNAAIRSDSLLFNRIDERLRLARERRGELEKQNAMKEAQWQAREERARQHYERQLEEKRKKLEEQRVKEERRRAAVEEKRRQKLEEDQARHEAVMRRTLDRSQRAQQKPNRWSWGGSLQPSTPSAAADADRRSVSTTNLSKHADSVITKRLSVSSATLLHSPDRGLQMRTASSPAINKAQSKPRLHHGKTPQHRNTGLRRLPLTPWEANVVNRLQQPTHSYLARSRSAMSLTGDHGVSCQPTGSVSFRGLQAQPLPHCRSQDRSLSRETLSSSSKTVRRRTTGSAQPKDRHDVRKSWSNLSLPLAPLLTLPPSKHLSPPGKKPSKAAAPSPGRPPQKATGRPPTPKLVKSPGAEDPGNLRPVKTAPESPQQPRSLAEEQEEEKHSFSPPLPRPPPVGQNRPSNEAAAAAERVVSPPPHRPSAGTTDPEEASRILAENRRLAREQREREEEERRQQEEQARLAREEMARRKAEERAKREEELQRQAEELRKMREEEERRQEDERCQREREEAARLRKQKEEEESRQREEAERLRQERERHFQKQEAERMERKKRLEEIMKRTRRSEPAEKKVVPNRNGDSAAASPSPSVAVSSTSHHGDPDPNNSMLQSQPEQRLSPAEGEEQQERQEETVPVAFRENGLLKPLGGAEEISAQQGADVA